MLQLAHTAARAVVEVECFFSGLFTVYGANFLAAFVVVVCQFLGFQYAAGGEGGAQADAEGDGAEELWGEFHKGLFSSQTELAPLALVNSKEILYYPIPQPGQFAIFSIMSARYFSQSSAQVLEVQASSCRGAASSNSCRGVVQAVIVLRPIPRARERRSSGESFIWCRF